MDIIAKHVPADKDGVRIGELDEMSYREKLWHHQPLTDFWRVGRGYAKKLNSVGLYTMGDIARCSLGEDKDFHNEEALKEYTRQVMEWTAMREREIDAIPPEVFPTDYHLFVADKGMQGTLEMEIDMLYGDIAVSWFDGNMDIMKTMVKDIYRYYGVSQEDIDHNTERYRAHLMMLSM